jgi:polyhydroxyalkanoate synthesis regulator phasin
MVMDALRGYVQLASGLTEVTRQRAQQAAKALLQQSGADSLTSGVTARVSELTDEIVATSKSNRQLLQAIVANEVEGAVARLGFVRIEEVAALSRRIDTLEREVAQTHAATADLSAPATSGPATSAPATSASVASAPVAPGGSAPAKKAAKKAPAKQAPAKKAAVESGPAKKSAAKKAAKKAPAKKA